MISEHQIQAAARAIVAAASSPARVILFGSRARGDNGERSDVDLLVIERELEDRFEESTRLAALAGDLGLPADIVVTSEEDARVWASVKGSMLGEALREGRPLAGY